LSIIEVPLSATNCLGDVDLVVLKPKRISLRDVLIVEAIDLDVRIFTPAPTVGANCRGL
jgi:hypothetical protein